MDNLKIGRNIKAIRINSEFSQKEVAEALGVSQQCYSTYECGRVEIPLSYLLKFCEETDSDITEILYSDIDIVEKEPKEEIKEEKVKKPKKPKLKKKEGSK